ncbi:NAD(P)/FAD-dependent oxidoreductase [Streptomyces sp. NPDC018029]|uniref:NAD(P)/FAD-dependent oxidoreductase n=1 Tax=Streptomyces sp. NPDC018029 TaxID=3365032 RepID=UPI00378E34DC
MTTTRPAHAVVLGASMAGTLAAHVLARHVDAVTVVERDALPEEPQHRKGVPQARHAHLLWSNGARLIEEMLPGTTDRLLAAGARRLGFPEDLVTLTGQGWQHRFPATQFALVASRPLLDLTVRQQALAADNITVRQRTEAVELTGSGGGSGGRVTGVVVRDLDSGRQEQLEADLVIDATGRGSRLKQWLAALGVPALEEDVVDAGVAYATRLFKAPPGATTHFPAVNIAADDRVREPGRFGVVYPIEGGRWLATLSCTRGAQLPTHEDEFLPFAENLNHPILADLLRDAEPLTPVFGSRSGANRRLYPERLEQWPDGLLVIGDSLTAFNPIYGHGMSSAARCATTIDREFERSVQEGTGSARAGTRALQKAIGAAVDDPWILAATKDIDYVNCRVLATDPRLIGVDTEQRLRFAEAITAASIRSPKASEIVTDVMSLNAPQAELGSNRFLMAMRADERLPELAAPPFLPEELAVVGLDAATISPTPTPAPTATAAVRS